MAVTAPETAARNAIKAALALEFAAEGFPIYDDRLHPSLGGEGKTRIATSPIRSTPMASNKMVLITEILVQFYGKWTKKVDNEQQVDPLRIETFAERFRRRMHISDPHRPDAWYFDVREITYPHDPTGNITRFEARVAVVGNNPALIETTG